MVPEVEKNIMFPRRKDPGKRISSIIYRARLAEMKLRVAENIRKENKSKPVGNLVVVSGLSSVFILPEFLEKVYVNAAINDLEKVYRELEKFKKEFVQKKYDESLALVKDKINEALDILKELKGKEITSVNDVEQGIRKFTNVLEEALNVIEKQRH